MKKKKVLVLDRGYAFKYMKSDLFDVMVVCLQKDSKIKHQKQGLNVIACFEEEYEDLPKAAIPDNYLLHSFDSDRFLIRYDWTKRQEILSKEITFWSRIFDEYHPDCIVNEVVTIEWMEVMSIEAKKRGIPYYRIALLPFDREDVWVDNNAFDSRLGKAFWESITPDESDFRKADAYISLTRGEGHKPYFIKQKQTNSFVILLKYVKSYMETGFSHHFKRGLLYEDYFDQTKTMLNVWWNRFFHRKYDKFEFQEGTEYFFYPIHYEPEATVEYFGYYFNDQTMLIGRIAHSLKTNQKLILKEHPQQRGFLMTKKYRDLKKKYSNLVFLPGNISSYDIYPHIKCLVTLCGTAGFESWICKRPVIVFGNVYYSDFPGIIQCDGFKQLYDVIRHDKYETADEQTILLYIAKMYHVMEEVFPVLLNGKINQRDCQIIKNKIENLLYEQ